MSSSGESGRARDADAVAAVEARPAAVGLALHGRPARRVGQLQGRRLEKPGHVAAAVADGKVPALPEHGADGGRGEGAAGGESETGRFHRPAGSGKGRNARPPARVRPAPLPTAR